MPKGDAVEVEATVVDVLSNGMFRLRTDDGHEFLGYVGGKMRKFFIRVLLGDRVKAELSPYDLARGRITYRFRQP